MPERLDPPEPEYYAGCDQCGGEIYHGDPLYRIDDALVHEDCFNEYAREVLNPIPENAGEHDTDWRDDENE